MSFKQTTTYTARVEVERPEGTICGTSGSSGALYLYATSDVSAEDAREKIGQLLIALMVESEKEEPDA